MALGKYNTEYTGDELSSILQCGCGIDLVATDTATGEVQLGRAYGHANGREEAEQLRRAINVPGSIYRSQPKGPGSKPVHRLALKVWGQRCLTDRETSTLVRLIEVVERKERQNSAAQFAHTGEPS
jgi:hypothetical protein